LSGPVAEDLHVSDRCGVERRERGLLGGPRVGRVVGSVERAAVAREDLDHALVGPRGDLGDLLVGRVAERVEPKHATIVPDVHAVDPDRVKMETPVPRASAMESELRASR
jgi:hypothetical protein